MLTPLEGIRVLEWGIFHAGPGGAAILSDLGAEVIKIEQPGQGDPIRNLSQYKGIDFDFGDDRNIFYEGANRGKKSICIDMFHDTGQAIAHRLIGKADVFVTNLRPPTVARAKMDHDTLAAINPDLIYAGVSCYGSQGPDGSRGGFDYQGQARSGFMVSLGEPSEKPGVAQFAVGDQLTAIMASYEVVIALLMRERFGVAQKVETSLLGSLSYLMYFNYLVPLITGKEVPKHEQAAADPQRNHYRCRDGRWLSHNQQPGEENWRKVCVILGLPDLAYDPRCDSREKRIAHGEELVRRFDAAFAKRTRDEWIDRFAEEDLVICAVSTVVEAIEDPQMAANGYLVNYDDPDMGSIRIPGFPIRFGRAETRKRLAAPRLGEHTEAVLKNVGAYSDEEILRFRKEKIISVHP